MPMHTSQSPAPQLCEKNNGTIPGMRRDGHPTSGSLPHPPFSHSKSPLYSDRRHFHSHCFTDECQLANPQVGKSQPLPRREPFPVNCTQIGSQLIELKISGGDRHPKVLCIWENCGKYIEMNKMRGRFASMLAHIWLEHLGDDSRNDLFVTCRCWDLNTRNGEGKICNTVMKPGSLRNHIATGSTHYAGCGLF